MSMTIEEIKKQLNDKGIALPGGGARKADYVKLYEEHIVLNNSIGDNYSSDEENSQSSRKVTSTNTMEQAANNLTNDELFDKLVDLGFNPGPVVENTRRVYVKKYLQLLQGETKTTNGNGLNNSQLGESQISDNEVEIKRPSSRNQPPSRGLRESPAPNTFKRESQSFSDADTSGPTRISYIEKIPRGTSQRFIEPLEPMSPIGSRNSDAHNYVGKWSPKIQTAKTTSAKRGNSQMNWLIYIVIAAVLIAVLGIVYHQWSVSDPYRAIEEEAEIEVNEFAARKTTA